jgi:hypothetical protein
MSSEKDIHNRYMAVSDRAVQGFLSDDTVLAERVSKLVSALYLVTSLVPEGDPLRAELRKVGVALVSDMTKVSSGVRTAARESVSVILSLLELSRSAGVVSVMNADLLHGKFSELLSALSTHGRGSVGQSALSLLSDSFSSPVKDTIEARAQASARKGHALPLRRPAVHASRGVTSGDDSRRAKIVTFIKDKERVSIKEVSRILPGLSEKTVQRELLDLVRTGVLNKEGERRWSVYTLA